MALRSLSTGKRYKNVYTILEKVKKGELKTHYKPSYGLFDRLDFYKKPDLIKPHMHFLDEERLKSIIEDGLSSTSCQKLYESFVKSKGFKEIDPAKQPDFTKYYQDIWKIYNKFPKHLSYDVFKMYNYRMEQLEFEERNEKNTTKFKFLEKANNPVGKIMTEGSHLKSAIFTKNMMLYYLLKMAELTYTNPEKSKQLQDALDGKDGAPQPDDMFDDKSGKDTTLDKLMQEASDLCKQIDKTIPEQVQERIFDEANKPGKSSEAGKLDVEYIRKIAQRIEKLNLSMGSLKDKIKRLLDKSASYFSSRKETIYDDLFNAESVAGLDEYELLHPKLRKIFIEDVTVRETKSIGKLDIYVDISGSMSSYCGVKNAAGKDISKLEFCKSFIAKLIELNLLNNVYIFNNKVTPYRNDIVSVAMLDANGGTDINKVIEKIKLNNTNSIVITDAEDHCSIYSDKAFFIGVQGAQFHIFDHKVLKEYSSRDQMIIFDGKTIKSVNEQGKTH